MNLKEELATRIKKRDDLKAKYDQLVGKRNQLESEYQALQKDCEALGVVPDDLDSAIQTLVKHIKCQLEEADEKLRDFENRLKVFTDE